jgi:hypothetical protein
MNVMEPKENLLADAPCPNMAGIIKAQKGNIRAALSTLDSRLDALRAYPNTQATESEGNA